MNCCYSNDFFYCLFGQAKFKQHCFIYIRSETILINTHAHARTPSHQKPRYKRRGEKEKKGEESFSGNLPVKSPSDRFPPPGREDPCRLQLAPLGLRLLAHSVSFHQVSPAACPWAFPGTGQEASPLPTAQRWGLWGVWTPQFLVQQILVAAAVTVHVQLGPWDRLQRLRNGCFVVVDFLFFFVLEKNPDLLQHLQSSWLFNAEEDQLKQR